MAYICKKKRAHWDKIRIAIEFSRHILTLVCVAVMTISDCRSPVVPESTEEFVVAPNATEKKKNKKQKFLPHLVLETPETLPKINFTEEYGVALQQQELLLMRKSTASRPIKNIHKKDLLAAVKMLKEPQKITPDFLKSNFDFHRISTNLKNDKVKFTSYYTPVIDASKQETPEFAFPIYRKPKTWNGVVPTADQIENGAFKGMELEIAWCNSLKTVRNLQMQGSGILAFADGSAQFVGYNGTNKDLAKHGESSKEYGADFFRDRTYVFFTPRNETIYGASGCLLTKGYSIAVDKKFIPLGACLLAEIPNLSGKGTKTYRILFAQDTGGAITSTQKVDFYCGEGPEGLELVKKVYGLGKLWLLLPKKKTEATGKKNIVNDKK